MISAFQGIFRLRIFSLKRKIVYLVQKREIDSNPGFETYFRKTMFGALFEVEDFKKGSGGQRRNICPPLPDLFLLCPVRLPVLPAQLPRLFFLRVLQPPDGNGRTITLTYNGDYLASITNTDGDSLLYDYDANGYLRQITNFNGEVYLTNTYDDNGRVVSQTVQDEGTFTFTYDETARRNTCTGENGYYLSIVYDGSYRIVESTNNDGTKKIEYDALNRVTTVTDRKGNTQKFTYDSNSNMTQKTDVDGCVTKYSYSALDLVSKINYNGTKEVTCATSICTTAQSWTSTSSAA